MMQIRCIKRRWLSVTSDGREAGGLGKDTGVWGKAPAFGERHWGLGKGTGVWAHVLPGGGRCT